MGWNTLLRKKAWITFLAGIFLIYLFDLYCASAVVPFGANYTVVNSSRAPADIPQSIPAQAGNVTELNIVGYSVTQSWQGYYGNVSGTLQLADGNDKIMYNWSLASPRGEIYASTNSSVSWGSLMCFNFSATGTYADDSANTGNTSNYGTNLSQLESQYNISSDDVDGINETFNLFGPSTHDLFYTSNLEFTEGECRSTRIYSNSGQGEGDKFEEVLLYDYSTGSVVFVSLLEQNLAGFDSRAHDFEIMVPEDGHGSDTSTTPYYFYVELQ